MLERHLSNKFKFWDMVFKRNMKIDMLKWKFPIDEFCFVFRYMLTQEGKEAASDCLTRSGMAKSPEKSTSVEIPSCTDNQNSLDVEPNGHDMESEVLSPLTQQKKPMNVPLDCLGRVLFLLIKFLVTLFYFFIFIL